MHGELRLPTVVEHSQRRWLQFYFAFDIDDGALKPHTFRLILRFDSAALALPLQYTRDND